VPDAAFEDFENVTRDDERPDAVVIGDLESGWSFETLNRAFRLIHERNAQIVGLGRTRYWKGLGGLQLDVGPFLAALEHATGRVAIVFGKPEPAFFARARLRARRQSGERCRARLRLIGDGREAFRKSGTIDELEDEGSNDNAGSHGRRRIGCGDGTLFESINSRNVRVIERREHLRLTLKPRESLGIGRKDIWQNDALRWPPRAKSGARARRRAA
jgi:hypothetical protein